MNQIHLSTSNGSPPESEPADLSADRLIFLLSQPRAGSTMLQSVLSQHDRIDTAPEPWLMLNNLWATRPPNITKGYGHPGWRIALSEFLERVPGGMDAYDQGMRRMALDIYSRLTGPGHLFLDKTPRYFLVIDDLMRVFPEAKYIVLFRNPLAVLMSMLATFPHPQEVCVKHASDLLDGPRGCLRAVEQWPDRVCRVQYETLVAEPDAEVARICRFLGVPEQDGLTAYGTRPLPPSAVGDPNVHRHDRPTTASVDKWKSQLTSRERVHLCLSYLDQLGSEQVAAMGYDARTLRDDVESLAAGLPSEYGLRDRLRRWRSGAEEIWGRIRRGHQRYHTGWSTSAA